MIVKKNARVIAAMIVGLATSRCQSAGIAPAQRAFDGSGSWIRHTSSQGPLIYGGYGEAVYIYDYAGEKVGELTGFEGAEGLCSDNHGDVYVADDDRELIYEYPPGGSLPVLVLDDRGERPGGCAVDPTTGALAVMNLGSNFEDQDGNVLIFASGSSGTPVEYTAPNIVSYAFGAYDSSGDLYVDGTSSKHGFALAALYKSGFTEIPLAGYNNRSHRAAGVQWDGQYVAVGDSLQGSIYRIAVSGSSGKIVQTVRVKGWFRHSPVGFAINGKKLLFPLDTKLLFFAYPAGGKKKGGFFGDVGSNVTVTNAQ